MAWAEAFVLFAVSHLVGDYLLQTDWQATHKRRGLSGEAIARRALLSHGATYTLAFVPALLWVADLPVEALWIATLVAVPHIAQDDGRVVEWWMRRVKHVPISTQPFVAAAVDQTLHVVALLAVALVAGR